MIITPPEKGSIVLNLFVKKKERLIYSTVSGKLVAKRGELSAKHIVGVLLNWWQIRKKNS